MTNAKFRAASLYINGKKAGYFESTDEDYASGDEPQYGDPGLLGFSDGAGMITLNAKAVHPIGGMEIPDLYQIMKNKQDLDIGLAPVNGKIHRITARCVHAKTTSSHKNGTQTGEYTFMAGDPDLV